jgi:DNA adenine methylase
MPPHRTYVEPFGGAASVLLRKPRCYAEIYNDLDGEIVNFFRVLRDHPQELHRLLVLTPFARVEFEQSYRRSDDPIEQARRTVVRSHMGFGSNAIQRKTGFRSNSSRSGTTPSHDWAGLPNSMDILATRMRGVTLENKDAKCVMLDHDGSETLHFVDPPYLPDTRDNGTDYRHELSEQEHLELLEFLDSMQGMVVLCGYQSDLYERHLFHRPQWRKVQRTSYADGARKRTEVLWLRNIHCLQPELF